MTKRITIPAANRPISTRVVALVARTVDDPKRGACVEVEIREGDTDWMAVVIDAGWARRLYNFLGDFIGTDCDRCGFTREHHLHRPVEVCPGCRAPQDHHDFTR